MPSEAKVYRYLRVFKGKRELITIGSSTDYTLELARLKAQTINSEIVSGIDPRAQDKAAKSILQILRDTSYIGKAAFGKTKLGPMHPDLRPVKGKDQQRQDPYSIYSVPEGEWICISVPPLVTSALFEAVQEQLAVNKTTRRIRSEGVKYLLQGLLGCKLCGYAFTAKPQTRFRCRLMTMSDISLIEVNLNRPSA